MDITNNGNINADEFSASLIDWNEIQEKHKEEWKVLVDTAFKYFDQNGDGKICIQDVEKEMRDRRMVNVIHGNVRRCFYLADTDSNGYIDRKELNKMLLVSKKKGWHAFASRHGD